MRTRRRARCAGGLGLETPLTRRARRGQPVGSQTGYCTSRAKNNHGVPRRQTSAGCTRCAANRKITRKSPEKSQLSPRPVKQKSSTGKAAATLRSTVYTPTAHGLIPLCQERTLQPDATAAAHIGVADTPAAAHEATGNRTGQALSHRTTGWCRVDTGARHSTPRAHHKAVNCCTAASGETVRPAPVSHWPQEPASSCAGRLARSQSIRMAAAIPATTLAAMAGAHNGFSAVAMSAACQRLLSASAPQTDACCARSTCFARPRSTAAVLPLCRCPPSAWTG